MAKENEFKTPREALEAIREAVDCIEDLRNGRRYWRLRVGPDFRNDPDMIILRGLDAGDWLYRETFKR